MTVAVRALHPSDRADWGRLWEGYLAFYETTRPVAQYDLHFSRLIDPADKVWHGLLALDGDKPVGLAHVLLHPHGWQARDTAYLQDLYVDLEARGAGAGRALMLAVYDLADRAGAENVYWTTQHFNDRARALYDKVGKLTPFVKYARA